MFCAVIANTRGMNSPRTPLSDTDRTLVDAWLDNQWLERGLSRHTLESYSRDLRQFGQWLAARGGGLARCQRLDVLEYLADRVGVITGGKLILVEEKNALMQKLGRKRLTLNLDTPLDAVPPDLAEWNPQLAAEGHELVYEFDAKAEHTGVPSLLRRVSDLGIGFSDLNTRQSSLEDIFVELVHRKEDAA